MVDFFRSWAVRGGQFSRATFIACEEAGSPKHGGKQRRASLLAPQCEQKIQLDGGVETDVERALSLQSSLVARVVLYRYCAQKYGIYYHAVMIPSIALTTIVTLIGQLWPPDWSEYGKSATISACSATATFLTAVLSLYKFNSKYDFFNVAAKDVDGLLATLGAVLRYKAEGDMDDYREDLKEAVLTATKRLTEIRMSAPPVPFWMEKRARDKALELMKGGSLAPRLQRHAEALDSPEHGDGHMTSSEAEWDQPKKAAIDMKKALGNESSGIEVVVSNNRSQKVCTVHVKPSACIAELQGLVRDLTGLVARAEARKIMPRRRG
eukprot:TRINITY_DN6952_c0_g1_i1.p1 TRINITY_DN6952_c0_g1~~TRINITY_DN6952_c0_g1_i1.p1  ORF type:complete len:323 (+),score=64.11 TRINITY_DN6952_c0_g1_i1:164-1132(+)